MGPLPETICAGNRNFLASSPSTFDISMIVTIKHRHQRSLLSDKEENVLSRESICAGFLF